MTPLQAGSRYGQYCGLLLVVAGLALKLLGVPNASWQAYGLYAVMPFAVLLALFGYQHVNRESPGFLQGLLAGFAASAVAGALFGLFLFIYHGFYDGSLLLSLVADAREELVARGLNEQQINHSMLEIREAHSPGHYALASFARMAGVGAATAVLFAPACGIARWNDRHRRLRRR
jgi:hypothetical protein